MYRYLLSIFLMMSVVLPFSVDQFAAGSSFPQRETSYIHPMHGSYLEEQRSFGAGVYLRRRYSTQEYRLYRGAFTVHAFSAEGNLQKFLRPSSLSRESFVKQKFFDRPRLNGAGDISDCYFQGDTLYVVGLIRVMWLDGTEWQVLNALSGNGSEQKGLGDIAVQTKPAGARIFLDRDDRGVESPNYLTSVTAGVHTLRLEHPDFAPVETTVTVGDKEITSVTIALRSRYGSVRFTGFPKGAEVKLAGRVVGRIPCTVNSLIPGDITFVVDDPFHRRREMTVAVESGSERQVSVVLAKAYGVIALPDVPTNSPWKINGEPVASGMVRFNPGTHRVFWSGGEQYRSIDTVVTVALGDTAAVTSSFLKRSGGVKVLPIPMACSLFVNGTYYGEAPAVAGDLTPGMHTVELRRTGYEPYRQNVQVSADEIVALQCRLKPLAVVSSHRAVQKKTTALRHDSTKGVEGEVSFVSFPPCAEVYSGDSLVAITGKGPVSIPEGRYSFRFVNGGQSEIKTVSVVSGQRKAVLVTFGEL